MTGQLRSALLSVAAAGLLLVQTLAASQPLIPVTSVDTVGMTVADMDRSIGFYTNVLGFEKASDVELSGREVELLHGVFGARTRVVQLTLGAQRVELTQYLAPTGRPIPPDVRANDRMFQHIAIIVSDMKAAYLKLRAAGAAHASTGPQRLPDWNVNAGGIEAFYFRDPDGHFLEVLHFPPDKGSPEWHRSGPLFLGIDHTAIVADDTERSLRFYRDMLGMKVVGMSENFEEEQEHLNNVFGARLRITTLHAAAGPGIELLEYLAPRDGRAAPSDLKANDIGHWQTTLQTEQPGVALRALGDRLFSLVSPRETKVEAPQLGLARALLVRDPDGHGIRLVSNR
jgi:catechol 2,3-dioxygenase-like lactoylglutathione lyase family enzyme